MRCTPAVLLLGAAISITICASKAEAQRGGHAASGGHAAFPAGGHVMGGRSWASPSPRIAPFRGGVNLGFNHRPGENGFHNGINDRRGFLRGFGGRRYLPFVGPYLFPPLIDYGLPFGYDFDDDDMANNGSAYQAGPDSDEQALEMNQSAMADQLQRLNAELADLRSAQQYGPAGLPSPYAPPYAPQYTPPGAQAAPPRPPLTLVLRNGQELKIDNYAVMNQTFWDFSSQPVRKIPLSSIDFAASEKATEANGGEFPAISSNQ
jgi:hypothetical protein